MIFYKAKGSAILTTIFLMFGILTISLIGLDVIMGGMASRRTQGSSARAFFAAESATERALSAFKMRGRDILVADCANKYLDYISAENGGAISCVDSAPKYYLLDNDIQPAYWTKIKSIDGQVVQLVSRGSYLGTNREIYVKFCLPSCSGKLAGDDDGCGGICK